MTWRRIDYGPATGLVPCGAAPTDVFVLDFDGVVVDSEPEVSTLACCAVCCVGAGVPRAPRHLPLGLVPEPFETFPGYQPRKAEAGHNVHVVVVVVLLQ